MYQTQTQTRTKSVIAVALISFGIAGMAAGAVLIKNGSEDIIPPKVTAISITPTEINTTDEDQTLALSVTIGDKPSGVCVDDDCGMYNFAPTQLRLRSIASPDQSVDFINFKKDSQAEGKYTANAVIKSGSVAGEWKVKSLFVVDKVGNYKSLNYDDLSAIAGASGLRIMNQ